MWPASTATPHQLTPALPTTSSSRPMSARRRHALARRAAASGSASPVPASAAPPPAASALPVLAEVPPPVPSHTASSPPLLLSPLLMLATLPSATGDAVASGPAAPATGAQAVPPGVVPAPAMARAPAIASAMGRGGQSPRSVSAALISMTCRLDMSMMSDGLRPSSARSESASKLYRRRGRSRRTIARVG
jgi:hypothetical protein